MSQMPSTSDALRSNLRRIIGLAGDPRPVAELALIHRLASDALEALEVRPAPLPASSRCSRTLPCVCRVDGVMPPERMACSFWIRS